MGSVTSGSRENWKAGTGTVYLTGQSTYRGDLALVGMEGGRSVSPYIYSGGVNSSSTRAVRERWFRDSAPGDQYCTGGAYSGERCSWVVDWTDGNWKYTTDETARNVTAGRKGGHCIRPGDSGGPAYTIRPDGGVAGKGIISGVVGYGGSDYYAGSLESDCRNVFTDLEDPTAALPGYLSTI